MVRHRLTLKKSQKELPLQQEVGRPKKVYDHTREKVIDLTQTSATNRQS